MTGDTHGSMQHGFWSCDGFMHRLNTENFPEQRYLTKNDYVVILGDFGGVWDVNYTKFEETKEEKNALDWLEAKAFTTLFVPGNHENYDRLTGCHDEQLLGSWVYKNMPEQEKDKLRRGYPQKEWHGGTVREIRPSVLMLEHGDVFDLNGCACFAFGGAASHDIQDGIVYPYHYGSRKAMNTDLQKNWFYKTYRISGMSWWADEIPSQEKLQHAQDTIAKQKSVDFVFTHDGPVSDRILLGYYGGDAVSKFLEEVKATLKYKKWFFGHLHDNKHVIDDDYLLYEQITQIA